MLAILAAYLSQPLVVLMLAVGGLVVLAAMATYAVMSAPRRASLEVDQLLRNLDAVTQKLNDAERIGKFGSFSWDFTDPSASFWSPEMFELCGLVPHKGAPSIETLLTTVDEKDREAAAKEWLAVQHRAGPFSFSFRTLAPSRELRYLHVQGKTTLVNGSPRLIEGVAQDVTHEIEVDRAKTEFVSLASHQLKTPLTSINWLSEMLLTGKAGPLSDQQREYLSRLHQQNLRMISLINELLNISRIELGTLAATISSFDICAVLHDVFEEQRHAADARKISVQLSCADGLKAMQGDQNFARMILQNLLTNAIKYSKEGGAVECEITSGGLGSDTVLIRVSDHGIGIPQEDQGRVFERMHRASNARTQVADGTGLGLYLIKLIVERAKGKISFESQENKGSTFYVSLPLIWQMPSTPAQNTG